jgi:tetratricopeptide (TPR) repeat protein
MPYQRNPHFTGRDELLTLLSEKLRDTSAKKYNHRVAIYGIGGVGKTQLAIEYVHRNEMKYDSIFWISSADQAALLSGFQEIARITGCVPNVDANLKPAEIAKEVLLWLRNHDGWLLVMDNMDEIEVAIDYLPEIRKGGHTLITTRNPNHLTIPAEGLQIPVLSEDAAVELLLLRGEIDCADDSPDRKHAAEIVAELGYLALAVEQAAAFIRSSVDGIGKFIKTYRASRHRFLSRKLSQSHPYPNSVAATFLLSFNKLDALDNGSQAIALLRLLAFLNPDGVLVDFLRSGSNGLDDTFRKIVEDDLTFHDVLELLQRYALVEVTQKRDYIVIHRLIQALIKDVMGETERGTCRENVISLCDSGLPVYDGQDTLTPPQRMEWRRLQGQILEPLVEAAPELNSARVSDVLLRIGQVLEDEGKYQDSERVLRISVGIRVKLFGEEAPETLACQISFAKALWRQEKLDAAATIEKKVLEARIRTLGKEHPKTLSAMNEFSVTLWSQGKWDLAVAIEEELLETRVRLFGEDDYETLVTMSSLAASLFSQRKLERAAALQEKVLEIRLRTVGETHIDALMDTSELSLTYCIQGKLEQAAAMQAKVLEGRLGIYGEDHPDTLMIMSNLASTLNRQGKVEQTKAILEKVLEGRIRILGEGHPKTLKAMSDLARTLADLGKLDEAETMQQKALEVRKRTLGEGHLDTLVSMERFSNTLWSLNKRDNKVREMEEKILEGRTRILGGPSGYVKGHEQSGLLVRVFRPTTGSARVDAEGC